MVELRKFPFRFYITGKKGFFFRPVNLKSLLSHVGQFWFSICSLITSFSLHEFARAFLRHTSFQWNSAFVNINLRVFLS